MSVRADVDPAWLAQALLRWYDGHRRSLPWRERPTPYRVMLSEFMLQQTRVETVLPYFERFTARWPTLDDLAAAREEEVLHAWAGLGYYSRARRLLAAARAAVERGGLPDTPAGLRELPGIGPYTAGAIASIAFGARAPLVDGNVERVLTRLDDDDVDPRTAAGKRRLWARADELVPADRPGDFNQALMELGATVCTPRQPACEVCPWRSACGARVAGTLALRPNKPKKKQPRPVRGVAGLLRTEAGWLVARRDDEGLLGGLWEPPLARVDAGLDAAGLERAVIEAFARRVGVQVEVAARLGDLTHVFSHRRLTLTVFTVAPAGLALDDDPASALAPAPADGYQDVGWLPDPAKADVALSKLARKALALAHEHDRELPLLAADVRRPKTS